VCDDKHSNENEYQLSINYNIADL